MSSLIISDLEIRVLRKKENGNKEEAERGGLEDIEEGDEIEGEEEEGDDKDKRGEDDEGGCK